MAWLRSHGCSVGIKISVQAFCTKSFNSFNFFLHLFVFQESGVLFIVVNASNFLNIGNRVPNSVMKAVNETTMRLRLQKILTFLTIKIDPVDEF